MDWIKIADDLREAGRYVRKQPMEARRQVGAIVDRLAMAAVKEELDGDIRAAETIDCLVRNLAVGSFFAVVAPDVFAAYITGAAFEVQHRTWAIEAIGREAVTNA